LKWIQDEYDAEVVALTINLGQPGEDYEVVKAKAMQLGALDCHVVDAREEFAHEYIKPAIKANAIYGLAYPLFTALGRPLIAKLAVEYARRSGCDTIAHGCTGKGNDQVRIEATVATLAPELKVIAPVRSWAMGRDEEIAYARRHGIPVKGGTESAPYSIDHILDRIVGLKVRDIYEAPAAALLLPAHRELERLVGTIHQNQFKPELDRKWAYLVYGGLWWEPLRQDIQAYIEHVNEQVTGT